MTSSAHQVTSIWQQYSVKSPHLPDPVAVIVARGISYLHHVNRLQNLNIYLPHDDENAALVDQSVTSLPHSSRRSNVPLYQVHVHGGAWRDPYLTSTSIEATVAHAFSESSASIKAIISLNYTISPFPTHPTEPYDPKKGDISDPAREAVHTKHVHDVLHGFTLFKTLGLKDKSYVLTGHSAGACLVSQSILRDSVYWGLDWTHTLPAPAAILGMNGLYDLPDLVDTLGDTHVHLSAVYENLQNIAFGADRRVWEAASPARADPLELSRRVKEGRMPALIVLDQSTKDQLVPLNQPEKLEGVLKKVQGLRVMRGYRCTGVHAAPWEQGYMI